MICNPGRYLRPCCLVLVLCVTARPAVDWVRTKAQLPAGYGAEGDRRRANRIPALVRPTVEKLSAGAEGSWVMETVEDGAWVYVLHLTRNGASSVTRLSSNGHVIQPEVREPVFGLLAAAGG